MGSLSRKGQKRLLAGLLAVFAALCFFTDTLGIVPAVAEEPAPTRGYNSDTYLNPLQVTGVSVKINGAELTEGGASNRFNDGDDFQLRFGWNLLTGTNHAGQTYTYDLTNDLRGVKVTEDSMRIDYTENGKVDFTYHIYEDGEKTILELKFGETTNVSNYSGTFAISGKMSVEKANIDSGDSFDIKFADKKFTLSPNSMHPSLNINKEVDGTVYRVGDDYYQNFRVTVTNPSDVPAPGVVVTDTHGELFTYGSYRNVKLNGVNASFDETGKLAVGDIPAGGSAVVEYALKLERGNMVSKNGSWNNAEATDTAGNDVQDGEWVNFNSLSVSKSGVIDGDNIVWTISVDMGVFSGEDFTLRDIPGANISAAQVAAALGLGVNFDGTVTIPPEKMEGSNGKYSISYSVRAPEANALRDTYAGNAVRLEVPDTPPVESSATVTIPANGTDRGGVSKTHSVTGNVVTWEIYVDIPDTDLSSLVIEDKIDDDWAYDGSNINIDYSSFKVTDAVAGTDFALADVGSFDPYQYKPNSDFRLDVKQSFLAANKGKKIKLSYNMAINDSTVSRIKNNVNMTPYITAGDKMPTLSASDEYTKEMIVSKEQDWGETTNYGRAARTWKVTLDARALKCNAGEKVEFTDTLPKGYMLQEDSLVVTTGDRKKGVIPEANIAVTHDPWSDTADNTFTVTVTLDAALAGHLSVKGNRLYFYYTANMTNDRYLAFNSTEHKESLVNKVHIKVNGSTDDAQFPFEVSAPNEQLLSKTITSQKQVKGSDGKNGVEASYRVEINKTTPRAMIGSGAKITVTDELGASLIYVDGSLKIYKYVAENDWSCTDVTDTESWSYKASQKKFTFTLSNKTYYAVEYKVKCSENDMLLSDELTYSEGEYGKKVKDEIERRFGNKVTITASDSTKYETTTVLDSKTYRKSSSYEHHIMIKGTKVWSDAATASAQNEIVILLTRYKKELPYGSSAVEDAQYEYHLCRDTPTKPDDGNKLYRKITALDGNAWTFVIDDLPVRDAVTGTDYYYSIVEQTSSGFTASYSDALGGDINDISQYFIGMDKQSGEVTVTNTAEGGAETGKVKLGFRKVNDAGTRIGGARMKLTALTSGIGLSAAVVTDAEDVVRADDSVTFTSVSGMNTTIQVPPGQYKLEEITPPTGFKKETSAYTFTVAADGSFIADTSEKYSYRSDIKLITLKDDSLVLNFRKSDGHNRVSEAVMRLDRDSGNSADLSGVEVIGAASFVRTADKIEFRTGNSDVVFKKIPAGKYTLSELIAPTGFYAETNSYTFTLNNDGTVTEEAGVENYSFEVPNAENKLTAYLVRLVNKAIPICVDKISFGSDDDNKRLEGARLKITRGTGNTASFRYVTVSGVADGSTTVIDTDSITFTTEGGHSTRIYRLPPGNYIMEEIETPPGHFSVSPFTFTVDNYKNVTVTGKADGDLITAAYKASDKSAHITVNDKTSELVLLKTNVTDGSRLGGAKIEIIKAAGNAADLSKVTVSQADSAVSAADSVTFVTTGTAPAVIRRIPDGTYIIKETKTPEGFQTAPDSVIKIENGAAEIISGANMSKNASGYLVLADAPKGAVAFHKSFTAFGMTIGVSGVQYSGVKFRVKNAADAVVHDNITPDADGLVSVTGLHDGTYYIEETAAPANSTRTAMKLKCVITDGAVAYTKIENGSETAVTGTPAFVNALNELRITKTDMSGTDQLAGATLEITGSGDLTDIVIVKDKDGNDYGWTLTDGGKTVQFTTIDGDNTAYIIGLPAGDYTLKETAAPADYLITSDFDFTVNADGSVDASADTNHAVDGQKITVKNKLANVYIGVDKVADDGTPLAGAVIEIRPDTGSGGVAVDLSTVTIADSASAESLTVSVGSVKVVTKARTAKLKGFPAGNYIVSEIDPPTGYKKVTSEFGITVDGDELITQTKAGTFPDYEIDAGLNTVKVKNEAYKAGISKVNVGGEQLPGARFTLTCTDSTADLSNVKVRYPDGSAHAFTYSGGAITLTTTSDKADNTAYFIGLPEGKTYVLREEVAPTGYKVVTDFSFTVNADGSVSAVSAEHPSHTVNGEVIAVRDDLTRVVISKTDMSGSAQIPGATLTISTAGGSELFDNVTVSGSRGNNKTIEASGGTVSLSFVTDDNTMALISGLPAGSYVLKETSAPTGYEITDTFYFTIEADGRVKPTDGADNGTVNGLSLTGGEYIIRLVDEPTAVTTETTTSATTAPVTSSDETTAPATAPGETTAPEAAASDTTAPSGGSTVSTTAPSDPLTSPATYTGGGPSGPSGPSYTPGGPSSPVTVPAGTSAAPETLPNETTTVSAAADKTTSGRLSGGEAPAPEESAGNDEDDAPDDDSSPAGGNSGNASGSDSDSSSGGNSGTPDGGSSSGIDTPGSSGTSTDNSLTSDREKNPNTGTPSVAFVLALLFAFMAIITGFEKKKVK